MDSRMLQKAIFLDRDGVINKELNYVFKIQHFVFIKGVFETCKYLINLGYKIIIITNQSGIARGYYSEQDFELLTNWMKNEFKKNGIIILDVIHCPHLPEANCQCRKPKPGMLINARDKHGIDMDSSWLIGDKEDDIVAANHSNISNTILVKSGHKINQNLSKAKYILDSIIDSKKVITN
tara:strand:- start:1639 stop:2178 length:540 start_codon:yes stop_codon:yes gene_type:complete